MATRLGPGSSPRVGGPLVVHSCPGCGEPSARTRSSTICKVVEPGSEAREVRGASVWRQSLPNFYLEFADVDAASEQQTMREASCAQISSENTRRGRGLAPTRPFAGAGRRDESMATRRRPRLSNERSLLAGRGDAL
jgi:hypothetical protein